MKRLTDKKDEFLRLLDEKKVFFVNPYLDFRKVCRFLRTCPSDLDEVIRKDQGMGGNELICDRRRSLLRYKEGQEG